MSVNRQQNWLGQQRVDVPHLRAIESSICNDFDLLAGTILGGQQALVISGFYLVTTGITQSEQLQLRVAGSSLIHFHASESGSIFSVPEDRAVETLNTTNTRVIGSWTPSQVNYIGVDLVRNTDDSTIDLVQFIDTTTLVEDPKSVPLARTLDYRIIISTTDFSSNPSIAPIAKVTLDSVGSITEVVDARNLMFRLGSGGTTPNAANTYTWPNGRKEGSAGDPFLGGDKSLGSLKDWIDAVLTRTWELGGGEFWYSSTADRNVKIIQTGPTFASTGEHFEWDGTYLHWKGLVVVFSNATGLYNEITDVTTNVAGLADLADGECIYVDVDPTQTRTGGSALIAIKGTLANLGTPITPGTRWVLAWRHGSDVFTRDHGWAVGSSFKVATTAALGTVKVSATDLDNPSEPTAVLLDSHNGYAIAGGLTRGGSAGSPTDFVGGALVGTAGDVFVGGLTNDHNVQIGTGRSQDSVVIYGGQHFQDGHKRSTLEVTNSDDFSASGAARNRTLTLKAYNDSTSTDEVAHAFYADGAIGIRFAPGNATTIPDAGDGIGVKVFVRKNGLSSPNTRDQLVVYFDSTNETVVIAQSSAY